MKCKYCDGTGEHINDANRMTTCEFCGGTGVIKPMTNEEWLKQCTTEQLAEWIADKINDTVYSMSIDAWAGDVDRDEYWQRKSEWAEWLKQPYSPK